MRIWKHRGWYFFRRGALKSKKKSRLWVKSLSCQLQVNFLIFFSPFLWLSPEGAAPGTTLSYRPLNHREIRDRLACPPYYIEVSIGRCRCKPRRGTLWDEFFSIKTRSHNREAVRNAAGVERDQIRSSASGKDLPLCYEWTDPRALSIRKRLSCRGKCSYWFYWLKDCYCWHLLWWKPRERPPRDSGGSAFYIT